MQSDTTQVYFDANSAFTCVDTSHFVQKGKLTNSLDKFYIYSGTRRNNQINEESKQGRNKSLQHKNDICPLSLRARLPTHLSPQPHPNSPQVNIASPPPPCKSTIRQHTVTQQF